MSTEMAQQWFKLYGGEYLYDPKIKSLNANERSCWLTLLCYASVAEIEGIVKHLTEEQLLLDSGVVVMEGYEPKILQKFTEKRMITVDNEMITIINWNKKQEKTLTPYERVKKFRMKNDNEMKRNETDVTNDNNDDNDRVEKSREEENRVEKKREDKHRHITYLKDLPSSDLKEFTERFIATEKQIKSKAEDLLLYCQSRTKTYKDYRSFLLNALKKDFKEKSDTPAGGKYGKL